MADSEKNIHFDFKTERINLTCDQEMVWRTEKGNKRDAFFFRLLPLFAEKSLITG